MIGNNNPAKRIEVRKKISDSLKQRYANGLKNSFFLKKHSKETKEKMSLAHKGKPNFSRRNEKHSMWKGDEVGYHSLHSWIKRRKIKPKFCEQCKKKPPYDLANISQEYKRDINDFKWLCRRWHMIEDGRMKNLT